MNKTSVKKIIYILIGSISLGLGTLGIFLPVLPTTPFLLISAWAWAKSSERLYIWLLKNKYFGKYIWRYRQGLGIPLRTKIIAISTLWITIIISIVFYIDYLYADILLFLIASAVTYHLASRPTYGKRKKR
jgi:uncharacterized protein